MNGFIASKHYSIVKGHRRSCLSTTTSFEIYQGVDKMPGLEEEEKADEGCVIIKI